MLKFEVCFKTDNYIYGEYFAEIIKELMASLEDQRYCYSELRLSVYGRKINEFENLAKWAVNHNVYSDQSKKITENKSVIFYFSSMADSNSSNL